MKKLISIVIMTAMLLSVFAVYVYADDGDNPGVEIMNSYLEEDINHYFLPVAYDLTNIYNDGDYASEYSLNECIDELYSTSLIVNQQGQPTVPPIKLVFEDEKYNPHSEATSVMWFTLYVLALDTEYKDNFDSQMRRAVCPKYSSYETAKRIFVAPWTLYNDGSLYTWLDLMEMSDDEIEKLNFATPDFEKFISDVKSELEARGWWKEEYSSRHEELFSHKDDYKNSLDESENFVFEGSTYNFSTLYYEYTISGEENVEDIISVNIHQKDFADIIKNVSVDISLKYKNMFDDIIEKLENDEMRHYLYWGNRIAGMYMMQDFEFSTEQQELIATNVFAYSYIINQGGYDIEEVRNGVEEYCYETHQPIPQYRIDMFVSGDLRDSVRAFATDNLLIYDVDKMDFGYMNSVLGESSHFIGKEDRIKDIDKLIEDIKRYAETTGRYDDCQDDIAYLESLLDASQPQTGENTILYIAIAAAALAAMTALVVRRKRKIVL